jgi:hypothetical protein
MVLTSLLSIRAEREKLAERDETIKMMYRTYQFFEARRLVFAADVAMFLGISP